MNESMLKILSQIHYIWDQLLIAGSDLQYRILLNLWNQCKYGNWEHIEYGFSHQYFQRPGFSTDPTNQMPRI